ncbi:MAG: ribonuclease T2 family protein [Hyphomicrobium sp.]
MSKRISFFLGVLFLGLVLIRLAQNYFPPEKTSISQKKNSELSMSDAFDYYTLVLSWSPSYCQSSEGRKNARQCPRNEISKYSFVLHGLWPQFEKGYPERCASSEKDIVPREVVEGMLDIMPSPKLIYHEYQKHGRCSGLSIKDYFKVSRNLFLSVKIPERYSSARNGDFIAPEELKQDFLNHNPQLYEGTIFVSCSKGQTPHLRDIRICFSKDFVPRRCGENEQGEQLCSSNKIHIPPRQ